MITGILPCDMTGLCVSRGRNKRIEAVRVLHGSDMIPEKQEKTLHVYGVCG